MIIDEKLQLEESSEVEQQMSAVDEALRERADGRSYAESFTVSSSGEGSGSGSASAAAHIPSHTSTTGPACTHVSEAAAAASVVPRNQRHGLFAFLVLIPELNNPRLMSDRAKGLIVAVVSVASMVSPMGGAIFLPAIDSISLELRTPTSVVNISYGIYILAMGIFPLWWSTLSEIHGRRLVYILSFALYTCLCVGCALSQTIAQLIVFRTLAGAAAASVQSVGAGTISDIYVPAERGRGMGYYYLGPLCGPLLAPILGGLITARWGWRATQWFMVIIGFAVLLGLVLFLPETFAPAARKQARQAQLKHQRAQRNEKKTQQGREEGIQEKDEKLDSRQPQQSIEKEQEKRSQLLMQTDVKQLGPLSQSEEKSQESQQQSVHLQQLEIRRSQESSEVQITQDLELQASQESQEPKSQDEFQDEWEDSRSSRGILSKIRSVIHIYVLAPFRDMKLLRYPPVLLAIIYSSICFFCLYLVNIGIQIVYTAEPYSYKPIIIGLLYIPLSVGYMISSIGGGYWSDSIVRRQKRRNLGEEIPEERIAENVFMAALLYPCALILFGWTAQYKLHWVVPLVGTFLFGLASMIIIGSTVTYLVDALPGKGSTGVALNNFVRMTLAAVAVFISRPLVDAIGIGWTYTMFALLSFVLISCLILIKLKGPKWRKNSPLPAYSP